MVVYEITSLDAEELQPYCRLTEAQLRNRLDPAHGIFIAESPKVIAVALDHGYEPLSVLTERRHIAGDAAAVLARCPDSMPVFTASAEVLRRLTGYDLTRGVLCAMRRPDLPSVEEVCRGARRLAVLDNVVNATNTGAIFRAAAALGIDALLLSPTCSDPFNRRCVRVSMGTVFQLPWTYLGASPSEWPHPSLDLLHERGFISVAMALTDRSIPIDDPRLRSADRLAILLGTEGDGLSAEVQRACRYTARIPMQRGVDSLNVAAAAAVAFWELRRR